MYKLRLLMAAIASCVAMGVVVAGLALPAVGTAGVGAREAAASFEALPAVLPDVALPQRSRILAVDGTPIATVFLQNRDVVALGGVPQVFRNAVVAVEDSRFYEHNGVDLQGLARAAVNNSSGSSTQGGSTLTQQYVKNVLLVSAETPEARAAATERSAGRKLREARLALELETRLTKDEILERYVNIAYFGAGAYGIQAASRHYFGKTADKLTLPEAALLAGVVKNPTRFDPTRNPQASLARRNIVLQRMLEVRYIDERQYEQAKLVPLQLKITKVPNGCETSQAPFYCDWVRRVLATDPAFGPTPEARRAHLLAGGLTIHTPLDLRIQKAAQQAVDSTVPRKSRVATTSVVVRPGTGEVVAMAVNRTFGNDSAKNETEFPLPTQPAFQPGSTFKAFTLAAALEQGVPLSLRLAGGERYTSRVLDNPRVGYFSNAADGEGGATDLAGATKLSINTFFVQLQERVGVRTVAEMAKRVGVTSLPLSGPNAISPREGSLTLGSREVSPLEMANAYATFAARGKRCLPVAITKIIGPSGKEERIPGRSCDQVISASVADSVTAALQGVITDGTGRKNANIGRPAAGKTGTTQAYGAAWFTGYTPQLSTAVWVGDPRGPRFALTRVLGYSRVFGGDLPAIVWRKTMQGALSGTPAQAFPGADPNTTADALIRVPDTRGLEPGAAVAALEAVGLRVKVARVSGPTDGRLPSGRVVGSKPVPGAAVLPRTTVTIEHS